MADSLLCPGCYSTNKGDATRCRVCGRILTPGPASKGGGSSVVLQRVSSGEVFTALAVEPKAPPRASDGGGVVEVPPAEPAVEDHSDVIAAAIDRIRSKAQADGLHFKPYVPSKERKATTPQAMAEGASDLEEAVGCLRERRYEDAIEPLLKAIARDDEDRRSWLLLVTYVAR